MEGDVVAMSELGVERAGKEGVPYTRAELRDAMQSIEKMSRFICEGAADKDVRGVAGDILLAAGIDGRHGETIRQKAQAIVDAVRSTKGPARTVYAPDPVYCEFTVSAAGALCLRKGLCIRVLDCDDLTALIGALLESLGIVVVLLRHYFGRDPKTGKQIQEHVLIGCKDEKGNVLPVDGASRDAPVGYRNPLVVRETEYDPHEVYMNATGKTPGPEIVTFGALPWRELRHDGRRYWERHRGRWVVQNIHTKKWERFERGAPRFDGVPVTGFGAPGDRVEPNPGGESVTKVRAEAAGSEIQQAVFSITKAAIDLESALDSYTKTRADLNLPVFEAATPAAVKGPRDFTRDQNGHVVWSPGLVDYGRWLVKLARHLASVGDGALNASRQIAFSDTADILIAALGSDPLRYVLAGTPGARVVEFTDKDGVTLWTMDDQGNRSVERPPAGFGGLPVIAIVAIVAIVALGLYFIVKAICDTVTTSINEKASASILECVQSGRCTADQGRALLQADADRRAAILKAETEKQKADPFASVAEAGASLAKTVLVVGAVGLGGYIIAKSIPAIQAWRAGVPKKDVEAAAEAGEGGDTKRYRVDRVPLNRGGYDPSGRYYGTGAPLYEVTDTHSGTFQRVRASNAKEARERALKQPGHFRETF